MAAMSRLSEHTLRTAASMSAGGDDLQILDGHRLARTLLGDYPGIAEPFGTLDDVPGEPAVLHGVAPMLTTGRGVVADGGGGIQKRLPRTVVD
jgi:hypothetical protein